MFVSGSGSESLGYHELLKDKTEIFSQETLFRLCIGLNWAIIGMCFAVICFFFFSYLPADNFQKTNTNKTDIVIMFL